MINRSIELAHRMSKNSLQGTRPELESGRATHLQLPLLLNPATLATSQPALPRTHSSAASRINKNPRRFSVTIPQDVQPYCATDMQGVSRGLSLRCVVPIETVLRDNSEELKRVSAEDLEVLRALSSASSINVSRGQSALYRMVFSSRTESLRRVPFTLAVVARLRRAPVAVRRSSGELSVVKDSTPVGGHQ
jgi:hypothetical protein